MPTLNINGHNVDVDEDFLRLSPDDQHAAVDHISRSLPPREAMREEPGRYSRPQPETRADTESAHPQKSNTWDFLSSIPRGIVKGAAGAAVDLGQSEANLTQPPEMAREMPGPEEATRLAEQNLIGRDLPKPEGGAGQYGATVGEFLGNPSSWVGPGGPVAKGASAVAGGLGSEALGQLTKGSPYEGWARVLGGAAGGAVGPRAVTPVPRRMPPASAAEHARSVALLEHEGVPVNAGDVTDSAKLKYWENTLGNGPNRAQQEAYTRAVTRRIPGTETPVIIGGPNGTIDNLLRRTGDRFERAAQGNDLYHDAQLQQEHSDIFDRYLGTPGLYPSETENAVRGALTRIGDVAQTHHGIIPGRQYTTLRSNLNAASMGAADPQRAAALREIVESLDNAMERSIANSGGTAGQFAQARRDYRNALVLEKAATAAGKDTARGYISPQNLANAAKIIYGRRAYARGFDDFSDLAQAGASVLEKLPDSGTSQRTRINNQLRAMATALGAGVGFHAGGGMTAAGEGGIAGLIGGEIAGPLIEPAVRHVGGAAIRNPLAQRWLRNQAIPAPDQYEQLARILRGGAAGQQSTANR